VLPEKLVYLLLDEGNYKITRFLEGNELVSAIQSPNHLIFCLQVPEGPDAVLADFRKDQPDGPISCFPRFFRLPRQLTPAARDELVMESVKRGVEERRSYSAGDLFSCGPVVEEKPFRTVTVVCKREVKLLTFM
jgi:hypothetical protein